jgi:hypothetical protein
MSNSESITLFVGAAAVAGTFLGIFVTALLSRASETSNLRQNWINSVRIIFAKFLSLAEKWTDISDRNSEEAYWARLALIEYVYQAKLYLNENEDKSKELMGLLESIPVKYKDVAAVATSTDYQNDKKKVSDLMQNILKDEWNRVRDGEILWSMNKLLESCDFAKRFFF